MRPLPRSRRAVALALVVVAGAAAGCTGGSDTPAPVSSERTVRVYLTRAGNVAVVSRAVDEEGDALGAALDELVAGPTPRERAWGFRTAVPDGVEVLGSTVAGGTATVDLSGAFDAGDDAAAKQLRLAQVVHTATQLPGVERVAVQVDGAPLRALSPGGDVLPPTLTRADFEQQTPAILVESPTPGDRLTSPLHLGGTADVFEGTVEYALVADEGVELATGFTTASCTTGCRGTFSRDVLFDPSGPAVLRVFERSQTTGYQTHVVEIPIVAG